LGATCPEAGSLVSTIDCSIVGTEALAEEQKWEERAVLKTLDEAARNATWPSPQEYHKWTLESGKMNSSDAVALARQRGANIQWDADACRNHRGWYRFKGGSEAAIARGLLLAPLCDVVFPCVWGVDLEAIERFAATILQHYPGKWLGLNWSVPPQGTFQPLFPVSTLRYD
jgi:isocitrate lyase